MDLSGSENYDMKQIIWDSLTRLADATDRGDGWSWVPGLDKFVATLYFLWKDEIET